MIRTQTKNASLSKSLCISIAYTCLPYIRFSSATLIHAERWYDDNNQTLYPQTTTQRKGARFYLMQKGITWQRTKKRQKWSKCV